MRISEILNEWCDPGSPCQICGLPHGNHRVQFVKKNPKVTHLDPNKEWVDHDVVNYEDHEFTPSKGYKPLTQKEAEKVGFHLLSSGTPEDIYHRINRVRNIRRVK